MSREVIASVILFASAFAVPASANVYSFSYSLPQGTQAQQQFGGFAGPAGPVNAHGTLSVDDSGVVQSISGFWNNAPILGLIAPYTGGATGYGGNDNRLFLTSPHVDEAGLGFNVAQPASGLWGDDGAGRVNIYFEANPSTLNGSGYEEYQVSDTILPGHAVTGELGTFDLTATPEPGFYGVLALGLTGLMAAVRRRRKNA